MILATDGPGTNEILKVLQIAFSGRAGIPAKIQSDARRDKLRPKTVISPKDDDEEE